VNTLIIAYGIVSLASIVFVVMMEIIPTHVVSLWVKELIAVVLLIGLAIGVLFVPTQMQKQEVIGDASLVQRFEDADLYYDENTDMYFGVEVDRWNPFEMYKRVEIPQALALEKIAEANGENAKSDP
jgi:hypothetical protein